jgi:hypothetical protein
MGYDITSGLLNFCQGKIFPHETVDISFLVAIGHDSAEKQQPDLAQVKITQINERSLVDIAKLLGGGAKELRSGNNKEFNKTKETVQMIPTWLLKYMLNIAGWAASCAGLSLPSLGVTAFPFGSCLVTSLGPLGIEEAFIPPTPVSLFGIEIYYLVCQCTCVLGPLRNQKDACCCRGQDHNPKSNESNRNS